MARREYAIEIGALDATLTSIESVVDLPKLEVRIAELESAPI